MTIVEIKAYINTLSVPELELFISDLKMCSKQRFLQKYNLQALTKKNYECLLVRFNIKNKNKHNYFWVTNGVEDKYIPDDFILDNTWHAGRTNSVSSTLGYKWYTNGSNTIYINPLKEVIPNGYYLGSLHKTTSGYHMYNDGENNIFTPENLSTIKNIKQGYIDTSNYKKAAKKRKKVLYNNGKTELKLFVTDIPPDGFVAGKLPKKSKQESIQERDLYYDSLGYIPIKALTTAQLTAYNYYRDYTNKITDIIYKKDTYTYINKKYLELLNEYSTINHSKGVSNLENEVFEFISTIYPKEKIQRHVKNIIKDKNKYYELDIYVPDKKIAIEFNGTYWHSSEIVPKNYHFIKSKCCENAKIRLIHIYEYEWLDKICQEKIKLMLNIAFNNVNTKLYARDCIIKEISNKEAAKLNNLVHLQGHRNAQVTLGLFYKNELVQLMSFSKTRYNKNLKNDNDWEIIRGCPGSNNIVVGGVSKLFKYFLTKYMPNKVFSYCDFNKFNGKSYEILGMKFIGYTGPDMKWILKDNTVVNRQPSKHKELSSIAKSKIFGAGSKKYEYTNV